MIVLVAVTFLLMSSFQKGNCEEMCETKSCLETGVRVLNSMNETVNPCDDFFEFACRGWITNNPIPKHEISWSTMQIIGEEIELRLYKILNTPDKEEDGRPIKMARELYRSCMNTKSLANDKRNLLTDAFTKLGLPMSPPTDEEAANLDISKIAGLAMRHYKVFIFVYPFLRHDSNNGSIYRLELEQLSPLFDNFDVYLRDPRFKAKVKNERIRIQAIIRRGGIKANVTQYAAEIMNFTTEIAYIMATPKERFSRNYTHYVMTISELQNQTDPDAKHWNWTTYMNALFDQTDVTVDPNIDTVYIHDMGYYENMPLLLSKISPGTIGRYVWYEVYSKLLQRTVQYYRNYGAHFGNLVYGSDATWYGCTNIVNKFFRTALTAAYVEKHFNVQNKKTVTEMWTDLISSFDEMLTEYKWMDDETKEHAHRKLHNMNVSIAYPEWITDKKKLEEHYKEYEGFNGSVAHMYTSFNSNEIKRILNRWKQTDNNRQQISGTEPVPRYSPSLNTIAIGAGAFHEPLYGNAAEALNYGALGALIGHEVTHGFDIYGQRYDENRTDREWWSDKALKHYDEKAVCIVKQYSKYNVAQLGKKFKLNGILTEFENIADIGGVAIAFKAYKKLKARSQPQQPIPGLTKYTDEQVFFLGYAQMLCDSFTDTELKHFIKEDPHSPGRFRIIGALRNSAEFAQVWNCPSGSPMNPKKKCTVW